MTLAPPNPVYRSDARVVPVDKRLDRWEPGFPIYGIAIDNNTGNWLRVTSGNFAGDFFVPPYCYGWQQQVIGARAVTVFPWDGPATLPSIPSTGDQVKVFVTEERIRTSIGYTTQVAATITQVINPTVDVTVENAQFELLGLTTVMTFSPGVRQALPPSPMVKRIAMLLQAAPDNLGIMYVGGVGVTADESATGGVQLAAGQSCPIDASDGAIFYGITASGTQKLIVAEAK
jgi:hypothetical protein